MYDINVSFFEDAVFYESKQLNDWLHISGKENRKDYPWDDDFENEAMDFYFRLYIKRFNEPLIRDAYASIPFVNIMDDHDIWDGYGSYPAILAESNGRLLLISLH